VRIFGRSVSTVSGAQNLPSLLVVHGLAWAVHGLVETPVKTPVEATRAAIRKRAAPGV
jgi:hypothetical protein